jgi:hypothetical protein
MLESTLWGHVKGNSFQVELHNHMHRLTKTQEVILIEWIILRDIHGVPPRPCHVQEIANIILQEDTPTPS